MTDDTFSPPFGGDDNDERPLPDHEYDTNETIGGGMMSAGGTAEDRGTGELGGQAQGDGGGDDDAAVGLPDGVIAGHPGGGAQSYIPAFSEDALGGAGGDPEDDEGGALPSA